MKERDIERTERELAKREMIIQISERKSDREIERIERSSAEKRKKKERVYWKYSKTKRE